MVISNIGKQIAKNIFNIDNPTEKHCEALGLDVSDFVSVDKVVYVTSGSFGQCLELDRLIKYLVTDEYYRTLKVYSLKSFEEIEINIELSVKINDEQFLHLEYNSEIGE